MVSVHHPPDTKRERKYFGIDFVVGSKMIPDFCVDLRMALAETIGKATPNVAAECVRTSRSRHNLHRSNRTSVPPARYGSQMTPVPGVVVSPER